MPSSKQRFNRLRGFKVASKRVEDRIEDKHYRLHLQRLSKIQRQDPAKGSSTHFSPASPQMSFMRPGTVGKVRMLRSPSPPKALRARRVSRTPQRAIGMYARAKRPPPLRRPQTMDSFKRLLSDRTRQEGLVLNPGPIPDPMRLLGPSFSPRSPRVRMVRGASSSSAPPTPRYIEMEDHPISHSDRDRSVSDSLAMDHMSRRHEPMPPVSRSQSNSSSPRKVWAQTNFAWKGQDGAVHKAAPVERCVTIGSPTGCADDYDGYYSDEDEHDGYGDSAYQYGYSSPRSPHHEDWFPTQKPIAEVDDEEDLRMHMNRTTISPHAEIDDIDDEDDEYADEDWGRSSSMYSPTPPASLPGDRVRTPTSLASARYNRSLSDSRRPHSSHSRSLHHGGSRPHSAAEHHRSRGSRRSRNRGSPPRRSQSPEAAVYPPSNMPMFAFPDPHTGDGFQADDAQRPQSASH